YGERGWSAQLVFTAAKSPTPARPAISDLSRRSVRRLGRRSRTRSGSGAAEREGLPRDQSGQVQAGRLALGQFGYDGSLLRGQADPRMSEDLLGAGRIQGQIARPDSSAAPKAAAGAGAAAPNGSRFPSARRPAFWQGAHW